jgi:hypothetical protein
MFDSNGNLIRRNRLQTVGFLVADLDAAIKGTQFYPPSHLSWLFMFYYL